MTTTEVAAQSYRAMSYAIEDTIAAGDIPLEVAIVYSRKAVAEWARVCRRAALAEEVRPDSLPVKCDTCGQPSKCDIAAHLRRVTFTSRTDRP